MKLLITTLFLMFCLSVDSAAGNRFSALKFGSRIQDYILYQPDMTPFRNQLSVCGWVRKLRTTEINKSFPVWLSYAVNGTDPQNDDEEITISDEGVSNVVVGYGNGLSSKSRTRELFGIWFHYCVTWRRSSTSTYRQLGVQSVYLNGELIGSRDDIPSTLYLRPGGYLMLGNEQDSFGGGASERNIFGGELYKVNIFSMELTGESVKEMADNKCGIVEETLDYDRHIKWEDILTWDRKGANVTEINSGCTLEELDSGEKSWLFHEVSEALESTKKESEGLRVELKSKEKQLAGLQADLEWRGARLISMNAEKAVLIEEVKKKEIKLSEVSAENEKLKVDMEKMGVELTNKTAVIANLTGEVERMKSAGIKMKSSQLIVVSMLAGVFLLTT